MTYELIEVEQRGAVGIIRKNRPEKLNAWSQAMAAEERHAVVSFNNNPEVAAIVFAGNGRAYCAGLDLQQQQQDVKHGRCIAPRRTGRRARRDLDRLLQREQAAHRGGPTATPSGLA